MKMLSRKHRLLLGAIIGAGLSFAYSVEFTDWWHLQAVTLNDTTIDNWSERFGLLSDRPIIDQPVEELAKQLLEDKTIARVDVSYSLPGTLVIQTNRFTPSCFVLDVKSGRMLGLNHQGRIVPLADDHDDWEHPVVTGLTTPGIFELCRDARVSLLMPELEKLADDNRGLYRLIDGINFASKGEVIVTVSGLPYKLKVEAASFFEQVTGFVHFVERYQPDLAQARSLDLRFAKMIVQESKRN